MPPITPSSSGCSRQCVCCKLWARSSTQAVIRCYSGQIKTQTFSKADFLFHFLRVTFPLAATRHLNQSNPCLPRPRHGMSEWVLGIIKRDYSLQFARRPSNFSGVVPTLVQSRDTDVLFSEVKNLLSKGAIETVLPAQSELGFYSHYFLIAKKDRGLQPILDLRHLKNVLWPYSSSRPSSRPLPLAPSRCFKSCCALWLQRLQCYSWACFICAHFSTS